MKSIILILSLLISSSAYAQFSNKQQKKDWFYLQTLSKQIKETKTCILTLGLPDQSDEWDKAWKRFYQQTDELSQEIELYVKNYKDNSKQSSTENVLTYTVWSVMFSVQEKTENPDKLECLARLAL